MRVYLAGPDSNLQCDAVRDMPVLLSFGYAKKVALELAPVFSSVLMDSGAYSAFSTGKLIDVDEYKEWSQKWRPVCDAIAGLDSIDGDYKKGIENFRKIPWSFPTMHDTDPMEILPELIDIAYQNRIRPGAKPWIGIGLKPPRQGKERFIREVCAQIPDDIHIHGWALRAYTHIRRLNSVDSTSWWRDAFSHKRDLPWLTMGECLEIVVKKYKRWERKIIEPDQNGLPFEGE